MGFRILSLDGGGSWALLQAMALADLYGADTRGHDILSRFELAAANSGGSLVLAGLACDWSPRRIAQMFLNKAIRHAVFARLPLWRRLNPIRLAGLGPKYSAEGKLAGLRQVIPLAELTLPEVRGLIEREIGHAPHFLIVGFDYDRRRAAFYRSNVGSLASSASRPLLPTLAEAVHASTNAPVNYFDAPAELVGRRVWDGAVAGYNNPVLAAVVEAMAAGARADELMVLSLGTASDQRPAEGQIRGLEPPMCIAREPSSLLRDVAKMATAVLDDPPDAATFIAHMVLRGHSGDPEGGTESGITSAIVRMSPSLRPVFRNGRWDWPECFSPSQWEKLLKLSMDATEDDQVKLIEMVGTEWLAGRIANEAVRASSLFEIEIGHGTYPEARASWPRVVASRMRGVDPRTIIV